MGMYDDEGYDDFNDHSGNDSGRNLREKLEAALAKNKELTSEVGKLRSQVSTNTLKSVLQERGLKPGLAKWMAKDEVDASDEKAVDSWLQENAEVFDVTPHSSEKQVQDAPALDAAADFAALQDAQANALPADASKLGEASRLMSLARTDEEIANALRSAMR